MKQPSEKADQQTLEQMHCQASGSCQMIKLANALLRCLKISHCVRAQSLMIALCTHVCSHPDKKLPMHTCIYWTVLISTTSGMHAHNKRSNLMFQQTFDRQEVLLKHDKHCASCYMAQ